MSIFDSLFYQNPLAGIGNGAPQVPDFEARRRAERAAADDELQRRGPQSMAGNSQTANPGSPVVTTATGQQPQYSSASGAPRNPNPVTPPNARTATSPNTPPAGSGAVSPNIAALARNNTVFDPSNPIRSMTNALARQGISTASANPVMRTIMSMAPGLAAAFLMRGASGQMGTSPDDINQAGGIGGFFGDFLRGALTGVGNQSAVGILQNPFGGRSTGDALRDVNGMLRQFRADGINGGGADMNPFTAALNNMLQNSSDGGAGLISSMYTPFMNPQMARAYGDEMDRRSMLAYDRLDYTDPNNSDVFSYLLGMR